MSPSRENTGGDQVARPRFCTSWSRQLATGGGATRTRAISGCYQLLPPWHHPHMILLLLLSPACCVGWCVVREKAYFVIDCCVAEGIVVEHCCCTCLGFFGPRTTRHERVREEAATKTARRAFGGYLLVGYLLRRALWQGGVSMCAVVVLCISSLKCDARGFMYIFVALFKQFCLSNLMQFYVKLKIILVKITKKHVPRSLQSWVSTSQSVVLAADVFNFS